MKWLLIACALMVGAIIVLSPDYAKRSNEEQRQYKPLFADLKSRINEIDRVTITRADEELTVYMDDNHVWRVKEAHDFPASSAEIRKLLLYLSQSELRDAKTANPELLPRLNLDEAQAFNLTLWKGEQSLYSVLLGKLTPEKSSTYVRPNATDAQSYTASGQLEVSTNPLDWLFYDLFSVKVERVRKVAYALDGHKPYEYRRTNPTEELRLAELPQGKELKQRYQFVSPAAFIEKLNFTEVLPASKSIDAPLGRVTVSTFDGLNVRFTLHRVNFENYFAIHAEADNAAYQKVTESTQEFTVTIQEADAINQRTSGWIYKLGQYHTNQLMQSYFELIQDVKDTP
jgi:Domain of unknown function (DUF4340)